MNLRAATCLALWSLVASALGHAQEANSTPMMIFPVGSYDAEEIATTLRLAFASEAEVSFAPVPSQSMVIVRCPQERLDEISMTLKSLTPTINPIWVRFMHLKAAFDFSAQERARLSGSASEVAQSIDQLRGSGRLQVVNDAELTLLPDIQGRLQTGEQVAIRTGSTRTQGGGNREDVHYQTIQVGTVLTIQADSDSDVVTLQLSFESSSRPNSPPVANSTDVDANERLGGGVATQSPASVATLSLESKLKIPSGRAQLVGGMSSSGSVESASQNLIVVATEIVSHE